MPRWLDLWADYPSASANVAVLCANKLCVNDGDVGNLIIDCGYACRHTGEVLYSRTSCQAPSWAQKEHQKQNQKRKQKNRS
jgi:hypothetical protein